MTEPSLQVVKGIYNCPVLTVKNQVGDIFLMRMQCPSIAKTARPGQFVNIKVNAEYVPFLRKPFSISRRSFKEGWIEVVWKIVGKGTEVMSQFKTGDMVNIIGPLGQGFYIPPGIKTAFLVGGGLGVAPLPFLCEELIKSNLQVEVFLGAKSQKELSLVEIFHSLGVEVFISTEDGSIGKQGLVTDILLKRLHEVKPGRDGFLYSCGPNAFLSRMMSITEKENVEGQIAIETMMGCGFGICVGCPVKVRNNEAGSGLYKLACIDGPVFNAKEIFLDD